MIPVALLIALLRGIKNGTLGPVFVAFGRTAFTLLNGVRKWVINRQKKRNLRLRFDKKEQGVREENLKP